MTKGSWNFFAKTQKKWALPCPALQGFVFQEERGWQLLHAEALPYLFFFFLVGHAGALGTAWTREGEGMRAGCWRGLMMQ